MCTKIWRTFPTLMLVMLACAGCGDQAVMPPSPPPAPVATGMPLQPSPTIAVITRQPSLEAAVLTTPAPPSTPGLAPSPIPTATPPAALAQRSPVPTADAFVYLWPAYLPPGMQLSPAESRVAREGELGEGGIGFFIVTFEAGKQKLVIGGGATETFAIAGEERRITVGPRQATLTTSGDLRQLVFDVPQGRLFVFGSGVSQEELLRVAESLQPIDVQELRKRVGAS